MKTKAMLALMVLTIWGTAVYAQFHEYTDLYHEELYTINPAATHQADYFTASLNSNLTNAGFDGAPRRISFYASGPVAKNMGIGLQISNDTRGAFNKNQLLASYAYKIKLGPDRHSLSMGISAGAYWQVFHTGEIDVRQPDDQVLTDNSYNKFKFSNEAGLLYRWKDLRVGISAPNVVQLYNLYYGFASYDYHVTGAKGLVLSPLVLYQYLPEGISQLDAGAKFRYKIVWTSFMYRTSNNLMTAVGLDYKRFQFGYSFNYNNNELSNLFMATHEVMLGYNFSLKRKAPYKRNPDMPWE